MLLGGKDKQITLEVYAKNIYSQQGHPKVMPTACVSKGAPALGSSGRGRCWRQRIPWMEMAKAPAGEGSGKPLGYFYQESYMDKKI